MLLRSLGQLGFERLQEKHGIDVAVLFHSQLWRRRS